VAKKFFYALALATSLSVLSGGCAAPTAKGPTQQTFVDKFSASVKSGTSKMAAAVMPKRTPTLASDSSPNGKPGPNVFVAVAEMQERCGKFDDAEAHYRKALAIDPKHLGALVGFARLEDRRSNFEAATRLYRRAIKAHPKNASVHNDLGLCYHRRGLLPDATRELKRAVELDDANKLYHDNLAAVYVEQDKYDLALAQLTTAHGTSVGHYNLGYLLVQKGNRRAALEHFQKAREIDHNLIAADQWIAKLSVPPGASASQAGGAAIAASRPGAYAAPARTMARRAYVAQRGVRPQQAQPTQYAPANGGPGAFPYAQPPAGAQAPPWQPQPDPMPPMPNR
jgi:tetratricopeptide (TPR) repeat protein